MRPRRPRDVAEECRETRIGDRGRDARIEPRFSHSRFDNCPVGEFRRRRAWKMVMKDDLAAFSEAPQVAAVVGTLLGPIGGAGPVRPTVPKDRRTALADGRRRSLRSWPGSGQMWNRRAPCGPAAARARRPWRPNYKGTDMGRRDRLLVVALPPPPPSSPPSPTCSISGSQAGSRAFPAACAVRLPIWPRCSFPPIAPALIAAPSRCPSSPG